MLKVGIDEFLSLSKNYPVLDVRSPGEYHHAHIPGAYNLPLFSDEERKVVGTAYKQESRESAIKIGLDYFGVKMRKMVEEADEINHKYTSKNILVHCWRGGMRSAGVAWLLDLYGYKVYTLTGGYKSFKKWALEQFDLPYQFNVLGGYTGSGKTEVLKQLSNENNLVINLEAIACHKGSAFGALGEQKQPTQEMFENVLAMTLYSVNRAQMQTVWIEDESQRIGSVNIPGTLFKTMRESTLYFLEISFEQRLNYITKTYGKFKKEELVAAIMRIQKRLGGLNTKNAINYLLEDDYKESFRILLAYYDKYYKRDLDARNNNANLLLNVPSEHIDAKIISKKLTDKKIAINGIND